MSLLRKKGRSRLTQLPDGRKRVVDRFEVRSDAGDPANLATVFIAYGTAHPKYTSCLLIQQPGLDPSGDQNVEQDLARVYEELSPTVETQVGELSTSLGSDGRKTAVAQTIQLSSATATPGVPGTSTAFDVTGVTADNVLVLDRETVTNDGTLRRITRYYIEATSTVTKIGDTQISIADSRAFTALTAGAVTVNTKFARQFTVRYIVKGDGTAQANWLAVSSTLAFASPAVTTYLTATYVVFQGIAHTTIARVYHEVPEALIYKRRGKYTFPGTLGTATGVGPYVDVDPITREISYEIRESYQNGEVAPTTLGFEPLAWAKGSISYTRATGEEGSKAYNFPGVIGSVSVSGSNKIFAGYLCSAYSGTVASNPTSYPTGVQCIASQVFPWRGNIWKKTDTYVTFP